MKYAYKETRRFDSCKLRSTCIRENWFNAGTNAEYYTLFRMTYDMENVTVDELVEVATYIAEYTTGADIQDDDYFCNMLYILANDACATSYFDIIR